MENFVYETPTKVYFGKDEELNVGKIIAGYAPKKVLVHFGGQSARKSGLLDRVEKALEAEGIAYVELGGVTANPELKLVREGIALCQQEGVDFCTGSWWGFCTGFFQRYCKWRSQSGY